MFRIALRIIAYIAAFILPIIILTGVGYTTGNQLLTGDSAASSTIVGPAPAPKPYDPSKPTVAIVLGTKLTEVSDFMIPYEIFSASGAFNVFAVAPQRQVTTLKGGLDVMPDYTLAGLDQLLGKSPDLIVTPGIINLTDGTNQPTLDWLRSHARGQTEFLSICVGAQVLAQAGLFDGHKATTHWNYIDTAEKTYPKVTWVRGLRYVDDGQVISSAGIASGVDASLHVVAQRLGMATAQRIANELNYPTFNFVIDPVVAQYHLTLPDQILFTSALTRWQRPSDGILLYNGVDELSLSSIFDTYANSMTTHARAIAPMRQWLTTAHGLQVLPRYDYATAPALGRLLVPGADAHRLAQAETTAWLARQNAAPMTLLQADRPGTFAYEAPLLDLARAENVPTAQFAAKAQEYRPATLDLAGPGWPWLPTVLPLLVGLAGVLLLFGGKRALARLQATTASNSPASRGQAPQQAISA